MYAKLGTDNAIALLRSDDAATRARGAESLGRFKPANLPQELVNCLLDSDAEVRQWAAWAVGRILGPLSAGTYLSKYRDLLMAHLKSDAEVQLLAEIALGQREPPPDSAPPDEMTLPIAPPAHFDED